MNVKTSDLTVTSIETITAFDVVTGDFKFMLDELQNATISQSQDTTDITGKQGRKLGTLKTNKSVTISGSNGLVSGGLLEVQTGGEFEHDITTTVQWIDYITVNSNAATTTYKAVGTTGNEIEEIYVKNADGTLGAKLTQGSSVSADAFTYDPTTKALAFKADEIADGTEIAVFYKRQIKGDVLTNKSDTYSGKATLYVDAFAEDTCGNVYRLQFYFPKVDFSGEFDLEFGDDQAVHDFEAEALAGASCGNTTASGVYWTYTVFGSETADA